MSEETDKGGVATDATCSTFIGKTVEDEEYGRGIIVGHENGMVFVRLDPPGCRMLTIPETALKPNTHRPGAATCSACGGLGMLPGYDQGQDDVMNTPCWQCNASAKLCGNCGHRGEIFNIPTLGPHLHCCHDDIDVRDTPPYNTGWGTLRDARQTCPNWISRQNEQRKQHDEN